MNTTFTKFVYQDEDNDNHHWNYCSKLRIPFVKVIKEGAKYWKIEFDTASITKQERFVIIDYSEHVIPLYNLYCQYTNIPEGKKSYSGGERNLVFTINKKDVVP